MRSNVEQPIASLSLPGSGALAVQFVAGCSTATLVSSASPFKLLVPCSRGPSVWAFASNFGGGLVAGDQTRLEVTLDPGTRCFLGTQASTKVYRNPHHLPCGHVTDARLGAGALLVYAPDPVQPFAGAAYVQRQNFRLAPSASLVLVDLFTAGRVARGERWQLHRFESVNTVWLEDQGTPRSEAPGRTHSGHELPIAPAYRDALLLSHEDGPIDLAHRAGRFNCFATLLALGPAARPLTDSILSAVRAMPVSRQAALLASASPIRDGVVLRLAGVDGETVTATLRGYLSSLRDSLGDDPWARKW